jgi:hypothetical protein
MPCHFSRANNLVKLFFLHPFLPSEKWRKQEDESEARGEKANDEGEENGRKN